MAVFGCVVDWTMSATMEARLALEALNRVLGHRQIEPEQLLIHSDQGTQYRTMDPWPRSFAVLSINPRSKLARDSRPHSDDPRHYETREGQTNQIQLSNA